MPELPEVETITQRLREGRETRPLPGLRVMKVSLRWPRHIEQPSLSTFRRRLKGRIFLEVYRRGNSWSFPLMKATFSFTSG